MTYAIWLMFYPKQLTVANILSMGGGPYGNQASNPGSLSYSSLHKSTHLRFAVLKMLTELFFKDAIFAQQTETDVF